MAWIAVVPPSPRHPHERYQVRYQEGKQQRSAGIFPTRRRALAEQRAIERGRDELVKDHEMDLERARTLFDDYVATKWWPAWKDQHPTSEYGCVVEPPRVEVECCLAPYARPSEVTVRRAR